MQPKPATVDAFVYLDTQHHGQRHPQTVDDRRSISVAAGAYVGYFRSDKNMVPFWGYGGVVNTETLFAYAICHAIDEHMAESDKDTFEFTVFIRSGGQMKYLNDYIPAWIANNGKNSSGNVPDAYLEWKRCYELYSLGQLRVVKTDGEDSKDTMKELHAVVSMASKVAFRNGANKRLGIVKYGNGFNDIK
jgi:hypothetical protein